MLLVLQVFLPMLSLLWMIYFLWDPPMLHSPPLIAFQLVFLPLVSNLIAPKLPPSYLLLRAFTSLCTSRGISYSSVSIPALGSILSRDRNVISSWLLKQSSDQHTKLFKLLQHPLLPSQHSFSILRSCMVPRMNYWSRVVSPDALLPTVTAFDKMVLDQEEITLRSRLRIEPRAGMETEE